MRGSGALAAEFRVWKAAWMQVDTFVERIEAARAQDAVHGTQLDALLEVIDVLESYRARTTGRGLGAALVTATSPEHIVDVHDFVTLEARQSRIPGVDDLEIAVGALWFYAGEVRSDYVVLPVTQTLFKIVEEGETSVFAVPSYTFGRIEREDGDGFTVPEPDSEELDPPRVDVPLAEVVATGAAATGLFPGDDRGPAAIAGFLEHGLASWRAEWSTRAADLPASAAILCTAEQVDSVASNASADRSSLYNAAKEASGACLFDKRRAESARDALGEAGADTELLGTIATIIENLASQAVAYETAKVALDPSVPHDPDALSAAAVLLGGTVPNELSRLLDAASDTETVSAGDPWVAIQRLLEARAGYPDGTLRMVRALEDALSKHWTFRVKWFGSRSERILEPRVRSFLEPFCASLYALLAGDRSTGFASLASNPDRLQLALPVASGADALPLARRAGGHPHDLSWLRPGQVAITGGARRTAVVALGHHTAADGLQVILTAPIGVSLAADPKLAGTPGLLDQGDPLTGSGPPPDIADLRRGGSATTPEHDGWLLGIVALWSRLCLLLGTREVLETATAAGREADLIDALWGSYSPVYAPFSLEVAPVERGQGHLVVTDSSAGGLDNGIARPGELMLLRGTDIAGVVWQTVIEVGSVSKAPARIVAEQLETEPDAFRCKPEDEVVLVGARYLKVPTDLVSDVTLHREFLGFGAPSLAAGVILPQDLDSATSPPATGLPIAREAEFDAAAALLRRWMGVP